MKKILLSVWAVAAMGSLGFADANVTPEEVVIEEDLKENNFYLGIGISAMSSRDASVSMDIFNVTPGQDRLGNISFHAGYEVNDYLAVEGRYATTLTDEDQVELSSAWSIFLKPVYKFEDDEDRANGKNYFAVYGLIGYGGVNLEGVNGVNANVDESGFQWGFGVSYTFREESNDKNYKYKESWTIFADYTDLLNDADGIYYNGATAIDADAFTVGLIYKF